MPWLMDKVLSDQSPKAGACSRDEDEDDSAGEQLLAGTKQRRRWSGAIPVVAALCIAASLCLAALCRSLYVGAGVEQAAPAPARGLETRIADAWRLPRNFDGALFNQHYTLKKRFDLSREPREEFEVQEFKDKGLTNSCANYVDNGKTVFTRDGNLILRVDSECSDGKCLNSGRIMSRKAFKYGMFFWTAKLPKCHALWPALWLLPSGKKGVGAYGQWPCSGEIDVMETIDSLNSSGFNIVTGYGASKMGCWADDKNVSAICDSCSKDYCMSTTLGHPHLGSNSIYVEEVNCSQDKDSHHRWEEHTFAFSWQPGSMITWVDPEVSFNKAGELVSVVPRRTGSPIPSWKAYEYKTTPTWLAAEEYMGKCYPGAAAWGAPFDRPMRLMLNLAVGGYGQAPCVWGSDNCTKKCGGAVGAEMVVSDISIYVKSGAGSLHRGLPAWVAMAAAGFHMALIAATSFPS